MNTLTCDFPFCPGLYENMDRKLLLNILHVLALLIFLLGTCDGHKKAKTAKSKKSCDCMYPNHYHLLLILIILLLLLLLLLSVQRCMKIGLYHFS